MVLTPNTNTSPAVRAPKQYNECERSLRLGQNMRTHVGTRSTWSGAEQQRSSTPRGSQEQRVAINAAAIRHRSARLPCGAWTGAIISRSARTH